MDDQTIEIHPKQGIDPKALSIYIARVPAVKCCFVVDGPAIRITYNEEKLSAKKLLKIVGSYDRSRTGKRKNVVGVREIAV